MTSPQITPYPGAPAQRRRMSTVLILATVLVPALVLFVLLGIGNWWVKNQELSALLSETATSEKAMDTFTDTVTGLVDDYNAQPKDFPGQQMPVAPLYAQVQEACLNAAAVVEDSAIQIAEVHILPWHRAMRDARAAYLKHIRAWAKTLRACASVPSTLNDRGKQVDIAVTWKAVCREFRKAVPAFALHGAKTRVQKTFDPIPAAQK